MPGTSLIFAADVWRGVEQGAVATLEAFHRARPDAPGLPVAQLRSKVEPRLPPAVFASVVQTLARNATVALDGAAVRLPGHAMKLALVVPGGVDRGGERNVIPALLALVGRLALRHEVHVFALHQEASPGEWMLAGAAIHNIGDGWTRLRGVRAICREHRRAPFDRIQAIFSGSCSLVAVAAARLLRVRSLVHIAGGELVALPGIDYGGRRRWISRLREALVLRFAGDLSFREVGVACGIDEAAARKRVSRGLCRLRALLGEDES